MNVTFSVVIPVLNEDESINELINQIQRSFQKFKKTYEIIFVDDGSSDGSLDLLKSYEKRYPEVRVFSFRKNLGKPYALMLGFQKARGEYIVTMDADLQDDPENIRALYEKMDREDYDMVSGWRKNRADAKRKIVSSKIFNALVSWMFGMKVNDLNGGLKLYRADVAKELILYGGMHRFIPVIVNEMGYKVGEKDVIHHARRYGYSKYKFNKIFSDIPDLFTIFFITKYTRRPLHFFGKIGLFVFAVGVLILLYLAGIHFFFDQRIGTRPLFFTGILFTIVGVQTIFTGLLADLIVNMNVERNKIEFPIRYESEK